MATFYLAAPWAEREQARAARQKLIDAGYNVNSRWLDFEKDAGDDGLSISKETLQQEAIHDLEDVSHADALILLNTQARGEETSGKAVEFGFAMGLLKPVLIVGNRTNVFHHLPIPVLPSIDDLIVWMKEQEASYTGKAS